MRKRGETGVTARLKEQCLPRGSRGRLLAADAVDPRDDQRSGIENYRESAQPRLVAVL